MSDASEQDLFQVKVPNPFNQYLNPPITDDVTARKWSSRPLQIYQNQLNIAILCSTTGCGVSFTDHLNHSNKLIRSVYRFHTYYQLRRILSELHVPLPTESSFNRYNNPMDMKAFARTCNEFNIGSKYDFTQKLDDHNGMGTLYYAMSHRQYPQDYCPGYTSFSSKSEVWLGSIKQKQFNAWTTFVLDKTDRFTQAGVERIN